MFFRALVALVLAAFLALNGVVLVRFGYPGFFETATSNPVVLQFFVDLTISLSLVGIWIYRDARSLDLSPWPFLVAGAFLGVAGPLAYILRRPRASKGRPGQESVPALHPLVPVVGGSALLLFAAFTFEVLSRYGYVSFLFYAGANEATRLLFVDVALSTVFLCVLMVEDARARRASLAPFLPLALLFGSVGPLSYLVTGRLSRTAQRLTGLAALALALFALTLGSGDADLRNETVRRAETDPGLARRGRERLERLAEKHGLASWRRHATMEVVARDVWPLGGPWWPENAQRFRLQTLLGTFTSRAELLDGRGAGELWGIQAWSPYKKKGAGAEVTFLPGPDGALTFYLPTLQYFDELPFRLLSASVVLDAGSVRDRDRTYDLVFVTWKRAEPQEDLDQYLLWIDRETGLVAKVRYTVREALTRMPPFQRRLVRPLVAGTIHFEDYRDIDGVEVPFVQTVTLPPPELTRYPLSKHFFHRLALESAAFDTVTRDELLPDPARGEPGDRKPSKE
jgi:hypothetical protein